MVFFAKVIVKYMKKNLDIKNPRLSKPIWPVFSDFVKSRFQSTWHFVVRLLIKVDRDYQKNKTTY